MARGRSGLEPGAILPVNHGRWTLAAEKLDEAALGIRQMRDARDRPSYEAAWTRFVDALEQFWARFFDEGTTSFTDFQPWAGAKIARRKRDPLLQYLIQSRHQSQHGRLALGWTEGVMQVAPGFNGYIGDIAISDDGTFDIDAVPTDPSMAQPKLVHSPGRPVLPIVINKRHGGSFPPPSKYCGRRLNSTTPIGVAEVALKHYSEILSAALEKWDSRD